MMVAWPWTARIAAIVALCAPLALVGAATAAQAGLARSAGAPGGLTAAAALPAPLVRDAGPAVTSKKGLAAPPMSTSMVLAGAQKQAQARRALVTTNGRLIRNGKCGSRICRSQLPAARDLKGTQQAQITGYFCGPATVSEMLAQMNVKLSQTKAASELQTTGSGTNWSDATGYPVPKVLNGNQKLNNYVAVALPWSPTAAQIKTYEMNLVTDINHKGGVPLAGNAYEVAGGPHLVGNPASSTIFHWIDIRGYSGSGAVTDYQDSVHGASSIGWSTGVPAYSSLASSTIVNILGARGYDW